MMEEKWNRPDTASDNSVVIPNETIDTLALCLLLKIQAYFDSPEGQAEFQAWKQRQETA